MPSKIYHTLNEIGETKWNLLNSQYSPFLSYQFLKSLEESSSISGQSGWEPLYLHDEDQNVLLYTFIKSHSYGEYIFDWSWADAYEQNNMPYYPKLTSMIPFTPATTSHFLMKDFNLDQAKNILKDYQEIYLNSPSLSSHFLFIEEKETDVFKEQNYLIRESMQYHFFNESYKDFDDFLSNLKNRKAKSIRKERQLRDIEINIYTGDELKIDHAKRMYEFYQSTIYKKRSYAYLNLSFFKSIFKNMKESLLYIEANKENEPIAGSLFFYDNKKLYGRYWGSKEKYQNLHFELCYYQGIDFCIQNKLEVFEAGAQGEHKIPRGFRPITTYSAHHLKHPGFHRAIENFIKEESQYLKALREELKKRLPFSKRKGY